jgi:hypothetical protein
MSIRFQKRFRMLVLAGIAGILFYGGPVSVLMRYVDPTYPRQVGPARIVADSLYDDYVKGALAGFLFGVAILLIAYLFLKFKWLVLEFRPGVEKRQVFRRLLFVLPLLAPFFFLDAVAVFDLATSRKVPNQSRELFPALLSADATPGRFTVVRPVTEFGFGDLQTKDDVEKFKRRVKDSFESAGISVDHLVDDLFEVNKRSIPIDVRSDVDRGYFIDRKDEYSAYFKGNRASIMGNSAGMEDYGGGWERLYKEHPNAMGITSISIPVYDKKEGIVLVYQGTQWHWLAGLGCVVTYEFNKGQLKQTAAVRWWIS